MLVSILTGLVITACTIALTLGSHWLTRKLFGRDSHKDKELASSVLTRIAALHALILALVFAQEMVDYQQLRTVSANEANAIANVYNDARRFGGEEAPAVQAAMNDYLGRVIAEDWPSLANDELLSAGAWAAWDRGYEAVLALDPADERQKLLRDHMVSDIHVISEHRVRRESIGRDDVSPLFWFAAVAGLIFSSAAYYPYDPERRSILLLSMYGAFTGIVLYLIYAFSNPYHEPGALGPGAFHRLQAAIAHGSGDPPSF